MSVAISRNSPCSCGSGKRYKDCCGALPKGAAIPSSLTNVDTMLAQALAAQTARNLDGASALYQSVLDISPDHADALHMLGVIRMEQGDAVTATRLILNALDKVGWRIDFFRHNLGLAMSKLASRKQDWRSRHARVAEYRARPPVAAQSHTLSVKPLVSVVIPSYNHAAYLHAALDSVFAQTYDNFEVVVVDDGSHDASPEILREYARTHHQRMRLIVRENRGAPATLNELVALSRGDWIQPLNSDDQLSPNRLETMVAHVAARGDQFGFGAVRCIDDDGNPIDELAHAQAFEFRCAQSAIAFGETVGFCFLGGIPAISTGNFFFSKSLFNRVGGFADLRYHHDWDFCLRAVRWSEPIYVDSPSYRYRLHGSNTIHEQGGAQRQEVDTMMAAHLEYSLTALCENPWAPTYPVWGAVFLEEVFGAGVGALVLPNQIRQIANELMTEYSNQRHP